MSSSTLGLIIGQNILNVNSPWHTVKQTSLSAIPYFVMQGEELLLMSTFFVAIVFVLHCTCNTATVAISVFKCVQCDLTCSDLSNILYQCK